MSIGVSNPKIQYVELDDDKKIPIKKLGIKKYALICGSLRKILKKVEKRYSITRTICFKNAR